MKRQLGKHLLGAYHIPANGAGYFVQGRNTSSLLLVVEDYKLLHEMRQVVLTTTPAMNAAAAPIVATRKSLEHHLALNPLFAQHLTRNGRCLEGQDLPSLDGRRPAVPEQVAYLIARAIESSAALAPQRLDPHNAAVAAEELHRLATTFNKQVKGRQLPPVDLFLLTQSYLERLLVRLRGSVQTTSPNAGPKLQIESILEDRASLLILIPPGSGRRIKTFNWSAVAERMPAHLSRVAVATAEQLRLATQFERPLDFILGTYRHTWGKKALGGLHVSAGSVFRQAARKPSQLLVIGLPGDYLVARSEEEIHRVIHDYQNRLLNMRLEQDLLGRIYEPQLPGVQFVPPDSLPKRDEPLDVRIDAIAEQLDWWVAQYMQHLKSEAATRKLSPL
jgi:hypothetical protein